MQATVTNNNELSEGRTLGNPMVFDLGTGKVNLAIERWFEYGVCNCWGTGFHGSPDQQESYRSQRGKLTPEDLVADIYGQELPIIIILDDFRKAFTGDLDHRHEIRKTVNNIVDHDLETSNYLHLALSRVESTTTRISAKLQERLNQFRDGLPGQEPVSTTTEAAVTELLVWLYGQAETVSATLSNDGMLTIAAVFPDEVRLYIEIERDGSAGAAVTKQRRFARDFYEDTIDCLKPGVILDAIGSI